MLQGGGVDGHVVIPRWPKATNFSHVVMPIASASINENIGQAPTIFAKAYASGIKRMGWPIRLTKQLLLPLKLHNL